MSDTIGSSEEKYRNSDENIRNKDRATLEAMASMYCKAHHHDAGVDKAGLCDQCRAAVEFTMDRVAVCPHGHEGNCQDCPTQCQRGESKENIKEIMRYAAPRMVFRHPFMTAEYLRKKLHR